MVLKKNYRSGKIFVEFHWSRSLGLLAVQYMYSGLDFFFHKAGSTYIKEN